MLDVFLNYVSCSLCSHRMEMSHSRAEARVSTESSPMSSGYEHRVRGCFYASPQLWRSAQGFQCIAVHYQGSVAGTLRDLGKGHTSVVGCGASHVLHDTDRPLCHSIHRLPGGKNWE